MKYLLALFSVLSVGTGTLVLMDFAPAEDGSHAEGTRSQIEQTERYLLEQESELRSADIKQKGILKEIERLEKDVASNRALLRELSARINTMSGEIQASQARIQELKQSTSAVRDRLKKRLVAFYKFGRPGYVRLLATSDTIQELQRTIKYMKAIMDQDRQFLGMLASQRSQVESELATLSQNMAKIEALKRAEDRRMAQVKKSIEEKVFLLMKIHREKEFYAEAVKELKEAAQALNQTMMHLEAGERPRSLPEGFAEMRGRLTPPLGGRMVADLKRSGSNPFMHRKGIYIQGNPGEEIRSVFPGRVDYSGWFKGYGQLIIINHGSRYFTVYAHLEERIKEKGDMVSGGEAVGVAGDPGWEVGPGVYFEIRRGGEFLDPKGWLQTG